MYWMQHILLFFVAFLVGADELLLGPILAPIGRDLSVRPETVTLFVTTYSLANAACAFFFGALSDRYGRAQILVASAIGFAMASVGTGLSQDFETALFFRMLTGAASAGMLPIAFAIAADQGGDRAVRSIAFVQAGLTLGMITSPGIGAFLTELFSWRVAFAGLGLAALPCSLLSFVVRSKRRTEPVSQRIDGAPLLVPGAAGALVAMGFGLGGGIGIFTMVGERTRDILGYGTGSVGLTYALLGVISVAGNFLMPSIVAQLGDGRRVMRIALIVCLAMNVVVYAIADSSPWLLFIALPLWALAGGIGSPALMNYLAGLAHKRRGAVTALGMSIMHVGVAISSGAAGLAYASSSIWTAVFGMIVFGIAMIALRPASVVDRQVYTGPMSCSSAPGSNSQGPRQIP
ncbi:MFS transporter [Brucella ciceri]|uniref:MFS transporter n=1 Tax=Brucella ciceri TaxID=391287 RepID=UPI001F140ACF|nr:MFS transporter [Brucella ciceri]MCH6202872.1 MFS transporter [Brucella ciceri]